MLVASAVPIVGFIAIVATTALQVTGAVVGNADLVRVETIGWGMLGFPIVPGGVYGLFFNRGRENGGTVPGAIDNLSGFS